MGMRLTGAGGLLGGLTKLVLAAGLEGEMDGHLGYAKHTVEGRDGGNLRNGTRTKTVITDVGPVEIDVPRDRDGTFDPTIVRKHQRRLGSVDDTVLSLSVKGLRTGEISGPSDRRVSRVRFQGHHLGDHRQGLGEIVEWQSPDRSCGPVVG
jgi:putative transposase